MTTLSNPLVVATAFFVATFIAGYLVGYLHGTSSLEEIEAASQPGARMAPVVALDQFGDSDGAA